MLGKDSSYILPRIAPMGAKDRERLERQKAAQVAKAAAEGYERGQAEAKAAVEVAQAEAAACEETLGVTARELKAASGKLERVRDSVANLSPWCRRPSTQAVRYVDEPRSLC